MVGCRAPRGPDHGRGTSGRPPPVTRPLAVAAGGGMDNLRGPGPRLPPSARPRSTVAQPMLPSPTDRIPLWGIKLAAVTDRSDRGGVMPARHRTAVLEVVGVQWASEKATVERMLGRRPGVLSVEANPAGQTATVTYDPTRTSVADLAAWIRDCGYHCVGQSVPRHVCDPAVEPQPRGTPGHHDGHRPDADAGGAPHGHHAGMSMDDMARDMRNRFLVAALVSIPILLRSEERRVGKECR